MFSCCRTSGLQDDNGSLVAHYLERTPFFPFFSDSQLQDFGRAFQVARFRAGHQIIGQGQVTDMFYVIAEGIVELTKRQTVEKGAVEVVPLCTKRSGDFFGITELDELLQDDSLESEFTVMPLCNVLCLQTTGNRMQRYFSSHPEMRSLVASVMGISLDETLGAVPWIKGVNRDMLLLLRSMCTVQQLKKHEVLFEEGSEGRELYIVAHGELQASTPLSAMVSSAAASSPSSTAGRRRSSGLLQGDSSERLGMVNIFRKGDYFGEIALAMNMPRTALVRATKRSLLLTLDKDALDRFRRFAPPSFSESFEKMCRQRTAESFRRFGIPFFSGIPEDTYSLLASLSETERFPRGTTVFAEGQHGDKFFIVVIGEVKVTMRVVDGGDETVQLAAEGAAGGASGFLDSPAGGAAAEPSPLSAASTPAAGAGSSVMNFDIPATAAVPVPANRSTSTRRMLRPFLGTTSSVQHLVTLGSGKYFGEIALIREVPRTATVTTTKDTVLLSFRRDAFEKFFQSVPEALIDFKVKLARYRIQMKHLIQHPTGMTYFRKYLEQEHSEENFDFWQATREFAKTDRGDAQSIQQRAELARSIVSEFVAVGCPREVNLKHHTSQRVRELMTPGEPDYDDPTPIVFHEAADEIYHLLERDSYQRFKQSRMFQEFLDASKAYTNLSSAAGSRANPVFEQAEEIMENKLSLRPSVRSAGGSSYQALSSVEKKRPRRRRGGGASSSGRRGSGSSRGRAAAGGENDSDSALDSSVGSLGSSASGRSRRRRSNPRLTRAVTSPAQRRGGHAPTPKRQDLVLRHAEGRSNVRDQGLSGKESAAASEQDDDEDSALDQTEIVSTFASDEDEDEVTSASDGSDGGPH